MKANPGPSGCACRGSGRDVAAAAKSLRFNRAAIDRIVSGRASGQVTKTDGGSGRFLVPQAVIREAGFRNSVTRSWAHPRRGRDTPADRKPMHPPPLREPGARTSAPPASIPQDSGAAYGQGYGQGG